MFCRSDGARRVSAAALVAAAVGLAASACASGPALSANGTAGGGLDSGSGGGQSTTFRPASRPKAPVVSGVTLTGSKLSLASYRGTVVVLNFWGSWCPPCRAEAPTLAVLSQQYRAKGVRFVGVDVRDSPASAEAFERGYGIDYPSLNDPGGEVALAFRSTVPPSAIPATLVIDRSGRIAGRFIGRVSYPGLAAMLATVTTGPGGTRSSGAAR